MDWTTPGDIRTQLERYWANGRLAVSRLSGESLFPLALTFRKPDAKVLAERFDEVRVWIRELENASKVRRGFGYEIEWTEKNHRQLGHNRVPARIVIPTEFDALRLLDKNAHADRFQSLANTSLTVFPHLRDWLVRKPLTVLQYSEDWERILAVLAWFCDHPQSGIYLRQIEIPGVDTKFIEERKGLLSELLETVLPPGAVEGRSFNTKSFEQRFGLLSKPSLIRFRFLDEQLYLHGLSDLAVPAADFGRLAPPAEIVFITENDINGLVFPSVPASMVIFGLGYGLERLAQVAWLKDRLLFYWGDIDTHGLAMLDRLRTYFPQVESFLMDRQTLVLHRQFWAQENERYGGVLDRLTAREQALYDDLRYDRLGERIRLEQERISFGCLKHTLRELAILR